MALPSGCQVLEYDRVVADRYPDFRDLAYAKFKGKYSINSDDVVRIHTGQFLNHYFIRCSWKYFEWNCWLSLQKSII